MPFGVYDKQNVNTETDQTGGMILSTAQPRKAKSKREKKRPIHAADTVRRGKYTRGGIRRGGMRNSHQFKVSWGASSNIAIASMLAIRNDIAGYEAQDRVCLPCVAFCRRVDWAS